MGMGQGEWLLGGVGNSNALQLLVESADIRHFHYRAEVMGLLPLSDEGEVPAINLFAGFVQQCDRTIARGIAESSGTGDDHGGAINSCNKSSRPPFSLKVGTDASWGTIYCSHKKRRND